MAMDRLKALRERAAVFAVKRSLPSRMTADAVAGLPDGLHAGLAGTGSPLPDRSRGNSCVAVIAGQRVFVVDAGERASETLNRMAIAPERIEAVLLTHFHSDHIGGLGSLNIQRWVASAASTPMRVIGPPGVDRVIAGFNEAYALDSSYRTAHHGEAVAPSAGAGMSAETYSIPAGEESLVVLEDGGLTVSAFTVDHFPAVPAVGYRFDYKGRSLVISGDTNYSPVLVRASKGADLLIHDALSGGLVKLLEEAARKAGQPRRAKIFADIPDYHASPEESADSAREAGVGALVLTHVIPPLVLPGLEDRYLGDAPARFAGPLWVAKDGDLYTLAAHGHGVERSSLIARGR